MGEGLLRGGDGELGGEIRAVTVLFADIRGFTPLTEKMDPKDVIRLINEYMTVLSHIVDEHEGIIDKYVGDHIMALFGAPVSHPNDVEMAVRAVVAMVEAVQHVNADRLQRGEPEVRVGIGMHTGRVIAGTMGSPDRLVYTVLGPNVNLAARVCAAAQPYQVLITEATFQAVKDILTVTALEPIAAKGFSVRIPVYAVESVKA